MCAFRFPFAALIAVACSLFPISVADAQVKESPKVDPRVPEGTEVTRNVAYADKGERNVLDIYVPKSETPLPLLIWIHGGGWQNGNKDGGGPATAFLKRGYAVASINYRLSQQAIFPAQIEDCKAAVRFLRANAKKYNLNPEAFGAWGSSAGGHLVALLGTTGDVKDLEGDGPNSSVSSRVQAVCDFCGPADLANFTGGGITAVTKLLGGKPGERTELAAKASPTVHVKKDAAPFLIVHGDKDTVVPFSQSEALRDALKKAGGECELIALKDGGHGGPVFSSPETVGRIAEFFDKNLKKK